MKKILRVLLINLLFITFVYADVTGIYNDDGTYTIVESESQESNMLYKEELINKRKDLNNYGVNKKWNIDESNKWNVLRTPLVNSSEKIYDFANILTEEEKKNLKNKIDEFIKEYNTDLVILTDSFNYISDVENEDYAADFYDYNDFGIDFEKYSGILFLRNANPDNPYYDIYTFGYAQLYFDDHRYNELLDDIYYDISGKNYESGFNMLLSYINKYYKNGKPSYMANNYDIDENGYIIKKYNINLTPKLAISGVVTFIIILILVKKNKMVKKATAAGDYFVHEKFNITKSSDLYVTSHVTSYTVSSSSGGSGGGGSHSHSGSSGGGHSSGGGRHG